MTISNDAPRVQLIADGTTGPYPFKFRIFSEEDVRVFDEATQKELTTHYTVDFDFLDDEADEGNINFVNGQQPAALAVITIDRNIPNERPTDLQQSGKPVQVELNIDLDKVWAKLQEIAQTFLRLVRLADTTAFTGDVIFPDGGALQAGKVIGWNTSGDGLENKELVAAGVIGLPLIVGEGGTGATTAAGARSNLDAQEDVVTTRGDLIRGSAAGVAERLALGSRGQELSSDGNDAVWGRQLPKGFMSEITLANGSDTDHEIAISPFEARSDDDTQDIVVAALTTKDFEVTWAVGDAAGGMESGSSLPTNDLLYIWGIKRSDTGVNDILGSLSNSSPTLPANYDGKILIGAVPTDGSGNIIPDQFTTYGQGRLGKEFVSAEQSISAAAQIILPHGLGGKPRNVRLLLRCKTAEQGYAVDDETPVDYNTSTAATTRMMSIVGDSTNLTIRLANNTPSFVIANKTTGSAVNATNANWRLIVEARR